MNRSSSHLHLELEVLSGLEPFLLEEWRELGLPELKEEEKGKFSSSWSASSAIKSKALRIARASFCALSISGRKPASIRGHETLTSITQLLKEIRLHGEFQTNTFRLLFSGKDSAEGQRIVSALEEATGLKHDGLHGEHYFRIRKSIYQNGWDFLMRLTSRPLSTRSYRKENYRGALDSTIAAAALRLLSPLKDTIFFDPCAGSGTLLQEVGERSAPALFIGGDINLDALLIARSNMEQRSREVLLRSDARAFPFSSRSLDRICTNLPWGEAILEKQDLRELYQKVLEEFARVLKENGRAVLITQAAREIERLTKERSLDELVLEKEFSVFTGSFKPTVYLFRKAAQ